MYKAEFDSDGMRDCFLLPLAEIFEAAMLLNEAVEAHMADERDQADFLIRKADISIIGAWLDSIWLGGPRSPIRAVRKIADLPPLLTSRFAAVAD